MADATSESRAALDELLDTVREVADRFRAMAPLIDYLNRPLLARKPAKDLLTVHF